MDYADQGLGDCPQPVRNSIWRAGSALLDNAIYTLFMTGSTGH